MGNRLQMIARPAIAVCTIAFAIAGCSSSGSKAGTHSTGSSQGASSASSAAKTYLDAYLTNPSSIGLTTALPQKPAAGKSVINLKFPTGVAQRSDDAQRAAAQALGWSYSSVDTGATPASAASAFEAAIAKKPNAIIFGGYPAAVFAKQIAEAKSAGITVVTSATGDAPFPGVLADVGGIQQEQLYAKLAAAYFVVTGGDKAHAAVFNFQGFPISDIFSQSFVADVKTWCPGCKASIVQQQLSDVGTKIASNAVSYLQRNPSIKWLVFASGDMAQGVSAGLNSAGLHGINIMGQVPTQTDIADIKNGTETAWVGYPVDILAWRVIDTFARGFENTDVASAVKVPLPMQMLTKDTVSSAVIDNGYYVGVSDYQTQFKKLWHVG